MGNRWAHDGELPIANYHNFYKDNFLGKGGCFQQTAKPSDLGASFGKFRKGVYLSGLPQLQDWHLYNPIKRII